MARKLDLNKDSNDKKTINIKYIKKFNTFKNAFYIIWLYNHEKSWCVCDGPAHQQDYIC